jgi:hypothetical protein
LNPGALGQPASGEESIMGIPLLTWDVIEPTLEEIKMMDGEDDLRRRGMNASVKKWVHVTLREYDLVHASFGVISPFCACPSYAAPVVS